MDNPSINYLLETEKGEIVGYTHTSQEADDMCKKFLELQWYKNKKGNKIKVEYFYKNEYLLKKQNKN